MKRLFVIMLAVATFSINASAYSPKVGLTSEVISLLDSSAEFKAIMRANGLSEGLRADEALTALRVKNPAAYDRVYAQVTEVQKVFALRGQEGAARAVKTFIDADLVKNVKASTKVAAGDIAGAMKSASKPVSSPSSGAKFFLAAGDAQTANRLEALEAKVGAVLVREEAIKCMKDSGESGDNLKKIISKTVNESDSVESFGNGFKKNMKDELEITADESGLRSCALTAGPEGARVAKEVFGIKEPCGNLGAAVSPYTCAK
jgi:hypothetical protein